MAEDADVLDAEFMICNKPLTLSQSIVPLMKPVWSGCISLEVTDSYLLARFWANNFISAFSNLSKVRGLFLIYIKVIQVLC